MLFWLISFWRIFIGFLWLLVIFYLTTYLLLLIRCQTDRRRSCWDDGGLANATGKPGGHSSTRPDVESPQAFDQRVRHLCLPKRPSLSCFFLYLCFFNTSFVCSTHVSGGSDSSFSYLLSGLTDSAVSWYFFNLIFIVFNYFVGTKFQWLQCSCFALLTRVFNVSFGLFVSLYSLTIF